MARSLDFLIIIFLYSFMGKIETECTTCNAFANIRLSEDNEALFLFLFLFLLLFLFHS